MSQVYYVFVNLNNPLTRANFEASGRITSSVFSNIYSNPEFLKKYIDGSADYLPFVKNENSNVVSPSFFNMSASALYTVEYNAEIYRKKYCPLRPSRLSCIYAFDSLEDCKSAIDRYGWKSGNIRQFQLDESPQAVELNRIHKVNMEVISLIRGLGGTVSFDPKEIENIWQHYWSGEGELKIEIENPLLGDKYSSGVIWENLIEGSLVCID